MADRLLKMLVIVAVTCWFPPALAFATVPVPILTSCASLDLVFSQLGSGPRRLYHGLQAAALAARYSEAHAFIPGADVVIAVHEPTQSRLIFGLGGRACSMLVGTREEIEAFIRSAGLGDA